MQMGLQIHTQKIFENQDILNNIRPIIKNLNEGTNFIQNIQLNKTDTRRNKRDQ